jgi:hypothetical protein
MDLQRLCAFAPVISNRATALANSILNLPWRDDTRRIVHGRN